MIQLNNLSKEFGSRILFNNVTFSISPGDKIGFVGRNGSGKSTLFKIIANEMSPDSGDIVCGKNYQIGQLKQHLIFTKSTILEECAQVLSEEEKFDDYKVEKILFGLGFSESDLTKNPNDFSGGYQIRLNLAKLFLEAPNLLLLDEPTNYLDIVSMRWLKDFLRKYPGEFVLVSHDRDFMNSVCNHTVGIHRQNILKIKGNIDTYTNKLSESEEIYENTRVNQEKKRKEIEDFVTRFKAKASKANQAQSRLKMLEKMDSYDKLENVQNLDFKFNYDPFQAKSLLQANDLSFGYGEGVNLFEKLDFDIAKGEKVAIIGKNGKGKSTLLNLIGDKLTTRTGEIRFHNSVTKGHFGQTNIERLDPNSTIEKEILSENPDLTNTEVRNICATMMFSGDDVEKKVNVLSGGEKSRVLLGKILAKKSNLLLLDEPTNHLDQESVSALVAELKRFEGGAVIVTHNEGILRELPTKFIIFHHDRCEQFIGSYDDFLEKVGWEDEIKEVTEVKTPSLSRKEYKVKRQELINERSRETKPLTQKIDKLEKEIVVAESVIDDANEKLICASEKEDSAAITSESKRLGENEAIIEGHFELLGELEEKLTEIRSKFENLLEDLESQL